MKPRGGGSFAAFSRAKPDPLERRLLRIRASLHDDPPSFSANRVVFFHVIAFIGTLNVFSRPFPCDP